MFEVFFFFRPLASGLWPLASDPAPPLSASDRRFFKENFFLQMRHMQNMHEYSVLYATSGNLCFPSIFATEGIINYLLRDI